MVRRVFLIIILLLQNSCVSYYKNEFGIFKPKYPNYSLKNKKGFELPQNLDTLNLYRLYGYYENDKLVRDENYEKLGIYKKFYSNSKVLSFGTKKLEENNLNPNYGNKGYYFYKREKNIIVYETFVIAEGGQYIKLYYKISKEGDTLTGIEKGNKSYVYIKEKIPKEWKRYKPNW